jgi:hypothetical protein
MKSKSKQKFLMASMMMLGCSLFFSSCGEDDATKVPTLDAVKGNYSGKVIVDVPTPSPALLMAASDAAEGVSVSATLKNDTIIFDDFIIKEIAEAIFPEEQTDSVIKALGKVKYGIGYKAAFDSAKDSIYLELSPKPIELSFTLEENSVTAVLEVAEVGKGKFALKDKALVFELTIEKMTINDEDVEDFVLPTLKYDMKQK